MTVPIRPIQDFVVVKPLDPPEKSAGGILLTAPVDEHVTGVVERVGPGKVLPSGAFQRCEVEPGVKVLYPKFVGTEIEHDGVKYRLMREDQILVVFG